MHIKNRCDSSKFKACIPLQLSCSLIENHPQSATFHTTDRYAVKTKNKKPREFRGCIFYVVKI